MQRFLSWIRAGYVGETPAGFIELHERPDVPEYLLWRFIISGQFQGTGVGGDAIKILALYVRGRPKATELVTSIIEGNGNPRGFYERHGFKQNGKTYSGETGLSLAL